MNEIYYVLKFETIVPLDNKIIVNKEKDAKRMAYVNIENNCRVNRK